MPTEIAIHLDELNKIFGRGEKAVHAVKDLTLEIESGQVFGFLGPNGAGKTTTIRMMLDLLRPTKGDVHLFGQHIQRRPKVLNRVGALVEDAAFYDFLTGWDNLVVLARTGNYYDATRIDSLLGQVGLVEHADKKVKSFSTGMKQRLGLAAALLSDPDLVVLDEPTNGLDPAGIKEMRLFIRQLADGQGKTVFLSSHNLNEVEQICDRVAIIREGELVREGPVTQLLSVKTQLCIQASPVEKAADLLREQWPVSVDAEWLTITAGHDDAPYLIRRLVEHNIDVYQAKVERQSLEDFFLLVTEETAQHVS